MKRYAILFLVLLSMTALLSECKTAKPAAAKTDTVPNPDAADISAGERIFTTTCDKCHGQPNPRTHDDEGWKLTMENMSVKAKLSDAETAQVLKYLHAANSR